MDINFGTINEFSEKSDSFAWLWSGLIPISIAVGIYFFTRNDSKKDEHKKLIKLLLSDIFSLCEKINRIAIKASYYALAEKYYYHLFLLQSLDKEADLQKHLMYFKKQEEMVFKLSMHTAILFEKISTLKVHGDEKLADKFLTKIYEDGNNSIIGHEGLFNKTMDKETLDHVYTVKTGHIVGHVQERSIGKLLMEIQSEIYPTLRKKTQ